MKRILSFLLGLALLCVFALRADVSPQEHYVLRYASVAVQEMYRSGVPASITLAQGILESRYGLSPLAAEGHNHFGIKCHKDWKGKSMKVDDDAKGECFRVYDDDIDSFRDHSDFLRYRDRYRFLFDYEVTDYKAWAYGLKKAGYATDPAYPAKLIRCIEDYCLDRYDRMKPSDFEAVTETDCSGAPETEVGTAVTSQAQPEAQAPKTKKKTRKEKHRKGPVASRDEEDETPNVIPESPSELEEAVRVTADEQREQFHFTMTRPVFRQNGVPFIYAREGESYASIAEDNNLFLKELLLYNDLLASEALTPGTVVYLQLKKNQTRKGLDKYIVDCDGEGLRDICQRFGVRMKSVLKMNAFSASHVLHEGDTIRLRK